MPDDGLTPLGQLLERARYDVLHISVREAARRAGMSDTRWRQVATGIQVKAGARVPVNPTPRTVVSMALAVGVDPTEALKAAGIEASDVSVLAMTREAATPRRAAPKSPGLVAEIERIRGMNLDPEDKIRIVNALIDLYQEKAQRDGESVDRTALA